MDKEFLKRLSKSMTYKLNLQLFAEDNVEQPEGNDSKGAKKEESEKKYTDEDVDRIIDKKFAIWEKNQQKKVDEAKKLAEMNAQERAEHERDELQKKLNEYEKRDTLAKMTKTARDMLKAEDIDVDDDLIEMLVTSDAEETKKAVTRFTKAFNKAVDEKVKKSIGGPIPKKSGAASSKLTKDEILKVTDRVERQRLIKDNIELFK